VGVDNGTTQYGPFVAPSRRLTVGNMLIHPVLLPVSAVDRTKTSPSIRAESAAGAPARKGRLARLARASKGRMMRVMRLFLWLTATTYVAFAIAFVALRYLVLPDIALYRQDIEAATSRALGLPVHIGDVRADWSGLRPELTLIDIRIDRAGAPSDEAPALQVPTASAVLAWTSLPLLEPRLYRLRITAPELEVRRLASGELMVAGLAMNQSGGDNGFADWLLAQREVNIQGASVRWVDEQRPEPVAVELRDVQFLMLNNTLHHRVALLATPPAALASQLDLRADFRHAPFSHRLADWTEWTGMVYADLGYMDAAELLKVAVLPIAPVKLHTGKGAMRAWADIADGRVTGLTADVALGEVHMRLAPELPDLALDIMRGRVSVRDLDENRRKGREFELTGFAMRSSDGIELPMTSIRAALWGEQPGEIDAGEVSAASLELKALADLGERLPFAAHTRKLLDRFAPAGRLSDVQVRWSGQGKVAAGAMPPSIEGHARFDGLVMRAVASERAPQAGHIFPGIPGFENISGSVAFTQQGGHAEFNSRQARLSLPGILAPVSIAMDQFTAQAQWEHSAAGWVVNLKGLQISNPDFELSGLGTWSAAGKREANGTGPGTLHFDGRFKRLKGAAVANYLPISIPQATRDWVARAILAGEIPDAGIRVHGDLLDFPFMRPADGDFRIGGSLQGARLDFSAGALATDGKRPLWPVIEDIRGDLVFERNGFAFTGASGKTLGTALSKVSVKMANFEDPQQRLELTAQVGGPLKSALDYLSASPIGGWIGNSLARANAKGDMRMNLGLIVPLSDANSSTVKGDVAFAGNELSVMPAVPTLTRMTGKLEFNERGAIVRGVTAQLLGGPVKIDTPLPAKPNTQFAVRAEGLADASALKFFADLPVMNRISGRGSYIADIAVRAGALEMQVDSNLQGIGLDMPAPMRKAAAENVPFSLQLSNQTSAAERARGLERESWRINLGAALGALAEREHRTLASGVVESRTTRASLGANIKPSLPTEGTLVLVQTRSFDFDAWEKLLSEMSKPGPAAATKSSFLPIPLAIAGGTDEFVIADKKFPKVNAGATLTADGWNVNFTAEDGEGSFNWQAASNEAPNGRIRARLRRLNVPQSQSPEVIDLLDAGAERELPALDVVVDDFQMQGRNMGKLEMLASNTLVAPPDASRDAARESGREWRVQKLTLTSERATFNATGAFAKRATRFDFSLDVHNIGHFIDEMGIKDVIRDGKARLAGNVNWRGSPLSIDYPTLSGQVSLKAERGQFLKTEPGIGRLIGVLNMQSLPRRITLDFRDVFSEGFAFDQITSAIQIKNGTASTGDFRMRGLAATVMIEGNTDLAKETQDLRVLVLPEINAGSASVAYALLANPAIGLGTFLAQWVLREPLAKAFSHEYRVTGNWADPKVDDAGRKPARSDAAKPVAAP
jgi:uncharacterized protein (TIGR02099 family)